MYTEEGIEEYKGTDEAQGEVVGMFWCVIDTNEVVVFGHQ